jgi:peptide deformylase
MAVKPILQLPEAADILRRISDPVRDNDATISQLVDDLWDSLKDFGKGRALSAIQIGVSLRVCVMDMALRSTELGAKKGYRARAMVNPVILERSWRRSLKREGCLSIPATLTTLNAQPAIWRHSSVRVGYFTPVTYGKTGLGAQTVDMGNGRVMRLQGKPLEMPSEYVEEVLHGDEARAAQHEIDHFDGILLPNVGAVMIGWRRTATVVQRVLRRRVLVNTTQREAGYPRND